MTSTKHNLVTAIKHATVKEQNRETKNQRMVGGGERNRTDDPLLAKQVLSQLSYTPVPLRRRARPDLMVGLGRLELPTSRLSGVRSNHLSYRPIGEAGRAAHTSFTVASKNTRRKPVPCK